MSPTSRPTEWCYCYTLWSVIYKLNPTATALNGESLLSLCHSHITMCCSYSANTQHTKLHTPILFLGLTPFQGIYVWAFREPSFTLLTKPDIFILPFSQPCFLMTPAHCERDPAREPRTAQHHCWASVSWDVNSSALPLVQDCRHLIKGQGELHKNKK